jgi:hypothetical protein
LFSIIVCSHRPSRVTFIREHYAALFRGHPHEFILIPDAASLCEGYSRGVRQSSGKFLVFSHDDVEFVRSDAAPRLEHHLGRFDVIGIAGTTKLIDGEWASAGDPYCFGLVIYPDSEDRFVVKIFGSGELWVERAQALDGCFFACRREVVERVGFDAVTFDGFHLYDLDFTYGAFLRGFRVAICRDLPLIHASMGNAADPAWPAYRARFETKYRRHLADGARGPIRELRACLPRQQLAWFCEPQAVTELIGKLG